MPESRRDRWLSIAMSVLMHGALIGVLAYGWWRWHESATSPKVSIEATVVDARTLKGEGVARQPAPQPKPVPQPKPKAPPQPMPLNQGPPVPTPQELAQREQQEKAEAKRQAEAEQELLKRREARQKAEAAQAAAKAKARKLAEARKRAEEKKLAREKKLAEERKRAEQKKLAEQRRLAAARKAAREKAAREAALAEMQRNIRQEEQSDAAAQAGLASWTQEIKGRIQAAWIKPPTAKPGIDCVLTVSEVKGGAVTDVSVGRCNGDEAVRESIEAAVYRASPLPPPPDPSLFQRQLIIEFKPNS